jgi:hypothetical protein
MRILSRAEVFNAIQYTKSITENDAKALLDRFCTQQPALQQMIFAGFPLAIESQNKQMAHLFMDLCFEIICVYSQVLGELPGNVITPQSLHSKMSTIEEEIKNQTQVNADGQIDLQNNAQIELLEYLGLVIEDAVGKSKHKQEIGGITYNLLFLVTRLLDSIYDDLTESHTLH